MKWIPVLTCLALAAAGTRAQADDSADAMAKSILQKANIHVGVCEMPRVGDGMLATALARQNVLEIQGLVPDVAAADVARKPAEAAHVLGSQVVVETGSPSAIPLQDWTADLLVIADATDANLAQIPPGEVKRVLSPYRGVAVVGQPANGKGGLTVAALTAWANQLGGTAEVKQDATGTWAVVKMPPLAGGDDWSHYYHAADGNPVSKDTALKGTQYGLQWMGGPYWAGKFDVHVAAGGREFHAQSTIYWRNGTMPYIVRARSLYNGQVLWEHPIAHDFGDIGSLMIATPDRLYIKDGSSAEALDAETGDEVLRFGDKNNGGDCKWIMLSDGVLVTMTGPKRNAEWGVGKGTGKTFDQQQNYENDTFYATDMDAWDAASGKPIWQFKDQRIDPTKTVIRDGHVYFYADYSYAACLDLKTGKQLWKTPSPIEQPKGPGMGLGWALNAIMTPRQSAIVTDQVYLINSHAHLQSAAFAVADGKLLWQKMKGKPTNNDTQTAQDADADLLDYPVYLHGKFYDRQWRWSGWDPLTGKPMKGQTIFNYSGCGHFTATESGLLFGQCGGVFDQSDHRWDVADAYSKAACGVSQFPVDGVLVKAPSDCTGCTEWRGFIVSRSGTDDSPQGVRFEKGPAYDATPAITACDDRDWPTYRSTDQRCASSATVIPTGDVEIRWTYSPTPSLKAVDAKGGNYSDLPRANPSPPIAVGDRIYFGSADGAVICLDRATGHELWRYWTAGQIMSAPTWAAGRLYVGSNDGWLYCLTADTGQLAWRYRVAPVDRDIVVFGRLSSQWPIMANVVVQDGTAYVAGGLIGTLGGSVMCALDAKTGQVKWEQDMLKSGPDGGAPPSAAGQLAYDHGQIFWHVANSGLRAVDAATGKITLAPDLTRAGVAPGVASGELDWALGQTHGEDIGVMPGGWIAAAGLEFFLPPGIAEEPRNRTVFVQTDVNSLAQPNVFSLVQAQVRPYLPAWDTHDVLVGGATWYGAKAAPAPPMLWHNFGADLSAFAAAHPFKRPAKSSTSVALERDIPLLPAAGDGKPAMPLRMGQGKSVGWYSPLLASNASVFLSNHWNNWDLYTFDRTNGAELNRIPLKGQPVMNGLALTRAGDVLVPMADGRLFCISAVAPAGAKQ